MIINNKSHYSLIDDNDNDSGKSINLYNLCLVLSSQIRLLIFILFLGYIFSFVSYNYVFVTKYSSSFLASDSKTLKFYYDKSLIDSLKRLDLKTHDFTNKFIENLSNFDLFLKTSNEVLNNKSGTTNYNIDQARKIYQTLKIDEININEEIDKILSERTFNIKIETINNDLTGKQLLSRLASNSNNLLTAEIKNVINNEINIAKEQTNFLKFSHKRKIEREIKLILDKIKLETKKNDLKYIRTLKRLEDNLQIANDMSYDTPQLSTIVQNPINTSNVEAPTIQKQSFYSDRIVVPAYFFGTKILEKEISFIKDRMKKKPRDDTNLAHLYIELDEIENRKKDIYINELDNYKDKLARLVELNHAMNAVDVNFVDFNLNNIFTNEISVTKNKVHLISIILALLVWTALSLFINKTNSIRARQPTND